MLLAPSIYGLACPLIRQILTRLLYGFVISLLLPTTPTSTVLLSTVFCAFGKMIVSNLIHMALALLLYFALNFACFCIDYTLANGFKPTWKALVTGQYRNCIARAWDLGGIYLFVAVLVAGNALASSCNWASTGTQWVTPCTHGLCATACAFCGGGQ
jgi:hypothetical protein